MNAQWCHLLYKTPLKNMKKVRTYIAIKKTIGFILIDL